MTAAAASPPAKAFFMLLSLLSPSGMIAATVLYLSHGGVK